MDRSLSLRRLCWKEYRQLRPLIAMLGLLALVFQAFLLFNNQIGRGPILPVYFFFGLPGLFAAGVGAMLVGQEKESKTLYWMASLPIRKQDIIRIKLLAGFVGLIAVWMISFLMLLISGGLFDEFGPISIARINLSRGLIYSLFLLVLGFATAWSFRSAFVGLLALVGIVVTYTIVSSFLSESINTITLVVASAMAVGIGWVVALRDLSPMAPPVVVLRANRRSQHFESSIVDQRAVQSAWSALVWQFANQNRTMLLGIVSMFFGALVLFSIAILATEPARNAGFDYKSLSVPGLAIGFVAISWLGAIVFQGDNLHQRIRFLADRGVSPKTVWATRQIVPFGLLILFSILLLIIVVVSLIWSGVISNMPNFGFVVLAVVCYMWTTYSVTQWVGQVVRSPIISAILAPVATVISFYYVVTAFNLFETPIWVLAVVSAIPPIATYRSTKKWMDSRLDRRYWLEQTGWLTIAVLIPTIPFLFIWATYPTIPANEMAEISEIVTQVAIDYRPTVEPRMLPSLLQENTTEKEATSSETASSDTTDKGLGDAAFTTIEEKRRMQMDFTESGLKSLDIRTPMIASKAALFLMSEAMLTRTRLVDEGNSDVLLKRYRRAVGAMVRIIHGVRQTPTLNTQQTADQYEAWLVREVMSSGAKDRLGPEVWSTAVAQLSDKAGRKKARLRALSGDLHSSSILTFRTLNAKTTMPLRALTSTNMIGTFAVPMNQSGTRLIAQRRILTVAWHLKQLLEASDDAGLQRAKELVAKDWEVPMSQLGLTATPFDSIRTFNTPCAYWHGEWEMQADTIPK